MTPHPRCAVHCPVELRIYSGRKGRLENADWGDAE